jgi:5-methylcytosine-specific restriction endonuclease McrA
MSLLPLLDKNGFITKSKKKIKNRHSKRRQKHFKKAKPLQAKDYNSYISSKKWAKRRRRYYACNPNTCKVCGSREEITLHHLTYERLGKELDADLMPLCWKHHQSFHDLIGGSKKNMVVETEQFLQTALFDEEMDKVMRNL